MRQTEHFMTCFGELLSSQWHPPVSYGDEIIVVSVDS